MQNGISNDRLRKHNKGMDKREEERERDECKCKIKKRKKSEGKRSSTVKCTFAYEKNV